METQDLRRPTPPGRCPLAVVRLPQDVQQEVALESQASEEGLCVETVYGMDRNTHNVSFFQKEKQKDLLSAIS